jgi:hypothetical protein
MSENTLKAAENASKANDLLAKATSETTVIEPAKLTPPSDNLVDLPAGIVLDGEVIKTAEVRELNGRDEEAILRGNLTNRVFTTILNRAVTRIGSKQADEATLDRLLIGDRDALLIGIYKATWGKEAEINSWCEGCQDIKKVSVDVMSDIKYRLLPDPNETKFTVKGKTNEYYVALPTGDTQKKLLANPEANLAESLTTLLEECVLEINGNAVYSKMQIQNLGIVDRRKIADAIADRNPGPQFDDLYVTCPDCESEVQVPISLGTLFQF